MGESLMDVEPTNTKTLLAAAVGLLMTVLSWVWVRLVGQQDRHEKRLIELEKTVATKGDITAVYESISELKNQSHDQHVTILNTLLRGRE